VLALLRDMVDKGTRPCCYQLRDACLAGAAEKGKHRPQRGRHRQSGAARSRGCGQWTARHPPPHERTLTGSRHDIPSLLPPAAGCRPGARVSCCCIVTSEQCRTHACTAGPPRHHCPAGCCVAFQLCSCAVAGHLAVGAAAVAAPAAAVVALLRALHHPIAAHREGRLHWHPHRRRLQPGNGCPVNVRGQPVVWRRGLLQPCT
jgi:hypothetical protein